MALLFGTGVHFEDAGQIVASGSVYFYDVGTTTLKTVYSDRELTTPLANPLNLNASGMFDVNVFCPDGERYTIRVMDSIDGGGAQVFSYDNHWGVIESVMSTNYTAGFTGAGPRTLQDRLEEEAHLLDFSGVDLTGNESSYTAMYNAQQELLNTGRRGALLVPDGIIALDYPLVWGGLEIGIIGASGEANTILMGVHSDGAVIQMKNRGQFLENIEINADSARQAGGAGDNFGLLIEGDDTADGKADDGLYSGVVVRNQPNSNIVVVGSSHHVDFIKTTSRDCLGGHGLVFDDGTLTGRTNKGIPGISNLWGCKLWDNEGHGLLLGNDTNGTSNRAFRIRAHMCDIFRNAEAVGSRKSTDQIWLFGDECVIDQCGIDGSNQAGDTATTRAALVHGRENKLTSNRYLEMNGTAVRADVISTYPTTIDVDGMHVVQTLGSNLNPAVAIDPDVDAYRVRTKSYLGIDRLVTDGAAGGEKYAQVEVKTTAEPVTSSTTLQDDDDLKVTLMAYERVQFRAELWLDGAAAGDIDIAFAVPSGAVLKWSPVNNIKLDASDAIVQQDPVTSGAITFGTGAGGRLVSIVGEVRTDGTAGDLQLQFAQNASNATATRILAQSWLEVLR